MQVIGTSLEHVKLAAWLVIIAYNIHCHSLFFRNGILPHGLSKVSAVFFFCCVMIILFLVTVSLCASKTIYCVSLCRLNYKLWLEILKKKEIVYLERNSISKLGNIILMHLRLLAAWKLMCTAMWTENFFPLFFLIELLAV